MVLSVLTSAVELLSKGLPAALVDSSAGCAKTLWSSLASDLQPLIPLSTLISLTIKLKLACFVVFFVSRNYLLTLHSSLSCSHLIANELCRFSDEEQRGLRRCPRCPADCGEFPRVVSSTPHTTPAPIPAAYLSPTLAPGRSFCRPGLQFSQPLLEVKERTSCTSDTIKWSTVVFWTHLFWTFGTGNNLWWKLFSILQKWYH